MNDLQETWFSVIVSSGFVPRRLVEMPSLDRALIIVSFVKGGIKQCWVDFLNDLSFGLFFNPALLVLGLSST